MMPRPRRRSAMATSASRRRTGGENQLAGFRERLRRLSINDRHYLDAVLGAGSGAECSGDLDPRSSALVRLGALIALDGPSPAFDWEVAAALAAGVSKDQLVDVLVTTAPLIGSAHVVSAAPKLARALDYDVDADLEAVHSEQPAT